MKKILVVGLGNILLQDEGIGLHVIEKLRQENDISDEVELVEGETAGLALLPVLKEGTHIIFVDAMNFEGAAGEIKVLRNDEIISANNMLVSVHEVGLRDIISLISLTKDSELPEIVLVGVKPMNLGTGLQLSPEVERSIPKIINVIKQEVQKFKGESVVKNMV
jgi:hydrogenase maturation protease